MCLVWSNFKYGYSINYRATCAYYYCLLIAFSLLLRCALLFNYYVTISSCFIGAHENEKNVPKESKENGKRIKRSYCSIKSSNTGRRRRRRQNQNMNRCSNSRFNVLFRCAMPNLLLLNEQYRTMQYILQICSIQAQSIQCVILKY